MNQQQTFPCSCHLINNSSPTADSLHVAKKMFILFVKSHLSGDSDSKLSTSQMLQMLRQLCCCLMGKVSHFRLLVYTCTV